MVCVPCVIMPVLLVLYKIFEAIFLRLKNMFWNTKPDADKESAENKDKDDKPGECFGLFSSCPCMLKKDKPQINPDDESTPIIAEVKKEL